MDVPKEVEQPPLPGIPGPPLQGRAGERFACMGKEVLCDGAHYADAVNADAASNIANALNAADMQKGWAEFIAQVK